MPEVPGPEGLKSEQELAELVKDLIPEPMRERALAERPIELRPVRPTNPLKPRVSEPEHAVWYRSLRELFDDLLFHRYLLAYGSDFHFLTTALKPYGMSWLSPGM